MRNVDINIPFLCNIRGQQINVNTLLFKLVFLSTLASTTPLTVFVGEGMEPIIQNSLTLSTLFSERYRTLGEVFPNLRLRDNSSPSAISFSDLIVLYKGAMFATENGLGDENSLIDFETIKAFYE